MHALVTGATGLIGNALAHRLVARGHTVRALVRDAARAKPLLPGQVELVTGDITQPETLGAVCDGVSHVFHAAGMPEQWQKDERVFDRVNRQGTVHVLEAAKAAGVRRVLYTSTMDVFAAPPGGTLVETNVDTGEKPTAYERSKQAAEREAQAFLDRGLDVVFLNPSGVYGPSPVHVGLNSFFLKVLNRQAPMLPPGGLSVVYVDGVVDAHLAAAERGKTGERYLVSDDYASNAELAKAIVEVGGLTRVPGVAPAWLMRAFAATLAPPARLFGFTPLVAPNQLTFLSWQVRVDASKAQRELGFTPTPLAEGVRRTVAFLREQGLVRG